MLLTPNPRSLRVPLAVLVSAAAACADPPPTAVGGAAGPPTDLDFSMPGVAPAHLIVGDSVRPTPPGGPHRVDESTGESGGAGGGDPSDYYTEVGTIYDPRTLVGFGPDFAYSWGEHRYQGNKGRVETTARVSMAGTALGSQSAVREDYGLFLIDGPRVKYIATQAKVYTDTGCGLDVRGNSKHEAWWEWFLGGGAPSWGRSVRTSSAAPKGQGGCDPATEPPSNNGSGFGGSSGVCWVSIDFDLETGEVLDVDVLNCSMVGEGAGG